MNILLNRTCFALGDWILLADVVHNITRTWPYINVDIKATVPDMSDVLRICGVRFKLVPDPKSDDYDCHIAYVMYDPVGRNRGQHILISMCNNVCKAMHKDIRDIGHLELVRCVIPSNFQPPERPYIIVPGKEAIKPPSQVKAYAHWDDLVAKLSHFCPVYELNTNMQDTQAYGDSAGIIRTTSLVDTAKLLSKAAFTVCTENGLNHWACHNGGRTFCLMQKSDRHATPGEVFYRTMTPITLYENDSPDYVFEEIRKHL